MRKRQTFMLTVLSSISDENTSLERVSFVGQIKVISSGKALTFTSLEELISLISSEMIENPTSREDESCPPPVPSTGLYQ